MAIETFNVFVAGEDALAEEVNENFDIITGKFNGGILNADISATAAIEGSKLSSAEGSRVPETRLETNAVSARVLQSDVSTGAPLAAVNTAAHIKDGIITTAKLAAGVSGKAILADTASTALTVGSIFLVAPSDNINGATGSVSPITPYAVADYYCLGVVLKAATGTYYSLQAFPNSGSTNWSADVKATFVGASLSTTFTFIFQAKT